METASKRAQQALDTINRWDWLRCDPDGVPFHPAKDLSFVINRLAMEGVYGPHGAVLTLLCQGDLLARGDFHWRKYQEGEFFQFQGTDETISPLRWNELRLAIADEWKVLENDEWSPTVHLERLSLGECEAYEWKFNDNRFSTAARVPLESPLPSREEWFSAYNIEVWPKPVADGCSEGDTSPPGQAELPRGRRPANWWPDFAEELAIHVMECGLPEGQGTDGQSEVIDEIFRRMVQAGKAEPARTTVQPVINAVLRRWRSAGKS